MVSITIPAKVVLFGEHLVLHGAQAVGATLHRYHHIQMKLGPTWDMVPVDEGSKQYFHTVWMTIHRLLRLPESSLNCKLYYEANFPDHYGWGRSSALVIAYMVYGCLLAQKLISPKALWEFYGVLKGECQLIGSGLDVYTQLQGLDWTPYQLGQPFQEHPVEPYPQALSCYPLYFLPYGRKVRSHLAVEKSLKNFKLTCGLEAYKNGLRQMTQSDHVKYWDQFCQSIQKGADFLMDTVDPSSSYIQTYTDACRVVGQRGAIKPCGALGGDGFLVWLSSHDSQSIVNQLTTLGQTPFILRLGGRLSWHTDMDAM